MSDSISRQAAIDLVEDIETRRLKGEVGLIYAPLIKGLRALPSVQPERIRGKWQWLSSTYDRTPCEMRFRCSVCHHETITHGSDPWEKFCPNCGADMREQDESAD